MSTSTPPSHRLRERLQYDAAQGVLQDGPRRYMLMRPDSLMGSLRLLDPATREVVFEALAQSTLRFGGDSLRAYAESARGDAQALIAATIAAAADLGWGQWTVRQRGEALQVLVQHSPFAAGWLASDTRKEPRLEPLRESDPAVVCAPIRGMLAALAGALGWPGVQVEEMSCAAQGHADCRFIATPVRADPAK
jgi:V4R domain